MLPNLDVRPLHLQRLSINLEEDGRQNIRVRGRVKIALELFGSCIEIECVIEQHLLKLALDARCPLQACQILDHAASDFELLFRIILLIVVGVVILLCSHSFDSFCGHFGSRTCASGNTGLSLGGEVSRLLVIDLLFLLFLCLELRNVEIAIVSL